MALVIASNGYYGLVNDRRIIKSGGFGLWKPEDVEVLSKELLALAGTFGGRKWGYIADPSGMDPNLSPETSEAFIKLHNNLAAAGCIAIAFLDGKTAPIRLLSQKHQKEASNLMKVLHFTNEAQALDWLKDLGV
jgi:hypothetical protein